MYKDPVCGMDVADDATVRIEYGGMTYRFCGEHCLHKFRSKPADYVRVNEPSSKDSETCSHDHASDTHSKINESGHSCSHSVANKGSAVVDAVTADMAYTCPMHPEVHQQGPGACPKCGMALEPSSPSVADRTEYVCPMHPEVVQDHPGSCPKCGMALEPRTVATEEDDGELRYMNRRFW